MSRTPPSRFRAVLTAAGVVAGLTLALAAPASAAPDKGGTLHGGKLHGGTLHGGTLHGGKLHGGTDDVVTTFGGTLH